MEYFTRLRNFWFPDLNALWWLLLALPALYFFQTTIHEGTHATAALVVTGNFPKLAPFPHRNSPSGNFLNGVTLGDSSTVVTVIERTSCTGSTRSRTQRLAGFPAMPINPGLFAFMTWVFWLAILSHFVWVYWSGWGRETVASTGFWDYRWIAFILGCLSLLAVLLSIFVNDPAIVKDSAEFIGPLIIQILALCWYWIYFGLTFKYRQ